MGKASKWFRGIFGLKKSSDPIYPSPNEKNKKKKWNFSMSTSSQKHEQGSNNIVSIENSSVSTTAEGYRSKELEWAAAAVMIQSHFRAYLSRRALRALKALVKLQALVRGHLLRKRTADTLRQLQALVRAQTRARLTRARLSTHSHSGPQMQRNASRSNGINNFEREKSHLGGRVWIDSKTTQRLWEQGSFTRRTTPTDDEKSDKVLQVDTENKPRFMTPKRRSLFHSSSDRNCQSLSTSKDSAEIQSFSPLKYAQNSDISSPRYYSASSKREEAFTPTKSDGSKSCLSGCSENPSYMAFTESSKAKARSLSVPKQRQQYEKSSSMKRYSVHESKREAFTNKAYPGSGRLDRLGVPIRGDVSGFSGGHWHRY